MAMRQTAAAPLKTYLKEGYDVVVPFVAYVDDEPCWITAVLDRTAVWCLHGDEGNKHLAVLDRVSAYPEHVRIKPLSKIVIKANASRRKGILASKSITVKDIYS